MNDLSAPPRPGADNVVPAGEYRDTEWDTLERERLWPRTWQMACRETEVASVGDFVNYEILDESILVVRTGDAADDLSAFYNVCQHRGRRLVEVPRGRIAGSLTCPFHGWQYSATGALKAAFLEEDWAGCAAFDKAALAIPKVQVARWGGWIWINQDLEAEPLAAWLGDAAEALAPFGFEQIRPLWWKTLLAPVNWKVVIEAFNEGYHSGYTHISGVDYRGLRSPSQARGNHAMFGSTADGFTRYRTDEGGWAHPKSFAENLWANNVHLFKTLGALTLAPGMRASERLLEEHGDLPTEQAIARFFDLTREEIEKTGAIWPSDMTMEKWFAAGTDWHLFPNSIVLPTLDGALWYRVRPNPRDRDSCIFDIWSFGRFSPGAEPKVEQESFDGFAAFRGQCPFLEEDFGNMVAVNKGVKSQGFRAAMTNPLQESTVSHFHHMLRATLYGR